MLKYREKSSIYNNPFLKKSYRRLKITPSGTKQQLEAACDPCW